MAKILVPTRSNMLARGFVAVAGTDSLYTHPSLMGLLFKRVSSVKAAVQAGGFIAFNKAVSGPLVGVVSLGATARYQYDNDLVGCVALPARVGVHKAKSQPYYEQIAWEPDKKYARAAIPFMMTLDAIGWHRPHEEMVLVAVVSKAYDGHISNAPLPSLVYNQWAHKPPKFTQENVDFYANGGGYGGYWFSTSLSVVRDPGWAGYVDAGLSLDLKQVLTANKAAYLQALGKDEVREIVEPAYDQVLATWIADKKAKQVTRRVRLTYVDGVPHNRSTLTASFFAAPVLTSSMNSFSTLVDTALMSDEEVNQAKRAGGNPDTWVHPLPGGSMSLPVYSSAIEGAPTGTLVGLSYTGAQTTALPATRVGVLKDNGQAINAFRLFGAVLPAYTPGGTEELDLRVQEQVMMAHIDAWIATASSATLTQREVGSDYFPEGVEDKDAEKLDALDELKYKLLFKNANSWDPVTCLISCFDQEVMCAARAKPLDVVTEATEVQPDLVLEPTGASLITVQFTKPAPAV